MPPITKEDLLERIDNDFVYHAPFGTQTARYAEMRALLKNTAKEIVEATPISREQSLALTKLEEAMFWANAAIARNEGCVRVTGGVKETTQQTLVTEHARFLSARDWISKWNLDTPDTSDRRAVSLALGLGWVDPWSEV